METAISEATHAALELHGKTRSELQRAEHQGFSR